MDNPILKMGGEVGGLIKWIVANLRLCGGGDKM